MYYYIVILIFIEYIFYLQLFVYYKLLCLRYEVPQIANIIYIIIIITRQADDTTPPDIRRKMTSLREGTKY